jgi:hypothetical protein
MLDAHATEGNRASKPVAERCAAGACEVVNKGHELPRACPVKVISLLLGTPRRDNLNGHT